MNTMGLIKYIKHKYIEILNLNLIKQTSYSLQHIKAQMNTMGLIKYIKYKYIEILNLNLIEQISYSLQQATYTCFKVLLII